MQKYVRDNFIRKVQAITFYWKRLFRKLYCPAGRETFTQKYGTFPETKLKNMSGICLENISSCCGLTDIILYQKSKMRLFVKQKTAQGNTISYDLNILNLIIREQM